MLVFLLHAEYRRLVTNDFHSDLKRNSFSLGSSFLIIVSLDQFHSIFFLLILDNVAWSNRQSSHPCLTFEESSTIPKKNTCSWSRDYLTPINKHFRQRCLDCTITNIEQIPHRHCHHALGCIRFFFDHSQLFASFFQNYRPMVEDLAGGDASLIIHIRHSRPAEIDSAYLRRTLNIDVSSWKLELPHHTDGDKQPCRTHRPPCLESRRIVRCTAGDQMIIYDLYLGVLTAERSFVSSQSRLIRVKRRVVNGSTAKVRNSATAYPSPRTTGAKATARKSKVIITTPASSRFTLLSTMFKSSGVPSTKSSSTRTTSTVSPTYVTSTPPLLTTDLPSTTLPSTTTSSSSSTSLPTTVTDTGTIATEMTSFQTTTYRKTSPFSSQSSSSSTAVFYLLSAFVVLILGIIVAATWRWLRQNSHQRQDLDNTNLINIHGMSGNDQYSIRDKDSKSAGSWSHGSPLLLPTFVK